MKLSQKIKFTIIVILIISISITFIYTLDEVIMPRVIATCDATMRSEVTRIINETIFSEYSSNFNYNEMVQFEKDSEGNITMMRADTLKLNEIATSTALKAQEKLNEKTEMKVKVPIGQITKNNLLANMGPKVSMKAEPIGHITTKYLSEFESAGINQTRHKIYIETTTKVRIVLPFTSSEIEIVSQIPVVETIIVGKVPSTAIQLDLNK
ncbi:MAG: sporulation protein YunB [Clostridium sp.]|nr:sporulation protein YunB [Clostridium sp.]